jgi:uncharacterized repeat protein (TIGR01451 family)
MHTLSLCLTFVRGCLLVGALLMGFGLAHAQAFLDVNKSFSPVNPAVGRTATMVITFTNNNPAATATLVSGTDTLPSGLAYATAGAGNCALTTTVTALFTGSATLNWAGGVIAPNTTCNITVLVTPLAAGTWVNSIPPSNVSGFLGVASLTGFSTASATITAGGTFAPITGVKTVSGTVIHGGGTRSYTITLSNPNTLPLTGLGFTDTLPTSLQVAVPGGVTANTCGGSIVNTTGAAIADGNLGIRLVAGALAPNGSCAITFDVRTANSTTSQQANNISNAIAANTVTTTQAISNAAFNVNVRVERGITLAKTFAPATIVAGGTSLLAITLNNFNLVSIPNAGLTDTFPAGVTGVSFGSASAACGTPSVTVSAANVQIANATLAAAPNANANGASSCVINLVVTALAAGSYANSIPAGTLAGGFAYATANATLTVNNPPAAITGTKSFVPASVVQDGTSLLTIRLTNAALVTATNASFTDNLSSMGAGITLGASPLPTNSCGGSLVATPGATSFSLSGGTIGATSSCIITVPVTVAGTATTGLRTNSIPAGAVSTSLGTNSVAITGNLSITADIAVTKVFSPVSVPQSGSSLLTITLNNAVGGPVAGITSFTDSLATMGSGITIRALPAPTTNCGGVLTAVAGSTTISLTGGAISAGASCQIVVAVDVAANVLAGAKTNTVLAGGLVTDQGNNTGPATAVLTVVNALTISKAYSPTTIGPAQVSRLTVTLTHTNGAVAFTGMGVTDALPVGHTVAAPPNVASTCGGTVTAVAGSNSFALSGAALPVGATSCVFAVNIQAPAGTGAVANTIPAGSVTTSQGLSNAVAATASLTRTIGTSVQINKDFTPPNINSGASSLLTVYIFNPNTYTLTSVSLTDAMPAGMLVYDTPAPSTTCSAGIVTALPGAAAFTLSGGTVPANGSCTFQVNVTSIVGGNLINTLPAGILTSVQSVTNGNSPAATLQVLFNLNLSKAFQPAVTQVGLTSALVVTVYNSNSIVVPGLATNTLADTFPVGLEIASGVSSTTCGGAVVGPAGGPLAAGDTGFRFDGGSFASGSLCTLSVVVRTTTPSASGAFTNTIPAGALGTAGGSNPTSAVAVVTFLGNPVVTKAFNPVSMVSGAVSALTFTVSNPNTAALSPVGLTNVQFIDALPAGLSINAPGSATGTCVGAGGNSFSEGQSVLPFTGLTIGPGANCTVIVQVTASTMGVFVNTLTGVVSTQTAVPTSVVASATLTVLAAPSISKSFSPTAIQSGGTGTALLTIVVSNPNSATLTLAATGGVQDVFPISPAGMLVAAVPASTTCAGATIRNSAGGALAVNNVGIRLNNGSVPPNGSCTLQVTVFLPVSGTYINTTAPVATTNAGNSAAGAVATITLTPAAELTVSKSNGVSSVVSGSTTDYTITYNNNGPADASGAMVRDGPSAGLSCTALACAASGGALCPSLNLPLFLSTGLSLPAFPNGGQVLFTLTCDVTASGQ